VKKVQGYADGHHSWKKYALIKMRMRRENLSWPNCHIFGFVLSARVGLSIQGQKNTIIKANQTRSSPSISRKDVLKHEHARSSAQYVNTVYQKPETVPEY
jgi:hypothetical protein